MNEEHIIDEIAEFSTSFLFVLCAFPFYGLVFYRATTSSRLPLWQSCSFKRFFSFFYGLPLAFPRLRSFPEKLSVEFGLDKVPLVFQLAH